MSEMRISRRDFLRRSGTTLAGTTVGSVVLAGCGEAPQELAPTPPIEPGSSYGPFKMGFQSFSLRNFGVMDDFLREARKLELEYVELYRGHLDRTSTASQVAEARQRLSSAGLMVNAFGVEEFTSDHETNKALFEFGKALGVANLSANPTKDAFSSLSELVQEFDIRIAIHNHGPEDDRWRLPEWILESVQDLDPRIGACADLGHFIRAGVDPTEAIEMLGSRVLGVHLKDFDERGNDVVLGTGQLDVRKSLHTLNKVGFDGPLSLEFEGSAEDPVPEMLECLVSVRQAARNI